MKSVLVIPDLQIPFHDPLMLRKVIKVAEELQPHRVVQIGDLIDFPQVSRWTKGSAGEYTSTLQDHIDEVKDEFLSPIRSAVPDAQILWISGNHDERLIDYAKKYAFPLTSLRSFSIENEFELEKFKVKYVSGPVRIATNTEAMHGHECGGYSPTMSAWDAKFAKRYGSHLNYVMGHTHQPGLVTRAFGSKGKTMPRWTMNVGSLMNPLEANYVKDGAVDWTMSFGVIHDDGKRVYPELVLATDRGFMYGGKKW